MLPDEIAKFVTRPALKDGKRHMVLAEPAESMEAFKAGLAERIKEIKARKRKPEPGDDIIPAVANDGRKASIDMRLVDPKHPNDPNSKLNLMIKNVHRVWKESKNASFHLPESFEKPGYAAKAAERGAATQIVFAGLGLNPTGTSSFSITSWFFSELRRLGVPGDEMANIKDYGTADAKRRLFAAMNEGKIRILFGSPEMLGTGINVQARLIAAHNLDPLWYPATDEQRVGRILRQGNMNPEIQVYDYSTTRTYDSTMWQMMETKGRFIESFWRSDDSVRKIEDVGMASFYEQAKAMSSGDPRLQQVGGPSQRRPPAGGEEGELPAGPGAGPSAVAKRALERRAERGADRAD